MIKVQLRELADIMRGLRMIMPKKLGAASYKVNKIARVIQKEFDDYEAVRKDLLLQYCKKDSDGNLIVENNRYHFESPEQEAMFLVEFDKLLNEEVEITIEPISFNSLGEKVNEFTPEECYLLDKFFVE
jgi:hypothetical protein